MWVDEWKSPTQKRAQYSSAPAGNVKRGVAPVGHQAPLPVKLRPGEDRVVAARQRRGLNARVEICLPVGMGKNDANMKTG
jgi:hypothetical protein